MGCENKQSEENCKPSNKKKQVELKAKVAIVIDDWGYSKKLLNKQ